MPMTDEDLDELKSLIAVARKRPVNFAVCLGKKPETTVIKMHRIKDGAILARAAKKEGDTAKITFGEVNVKGKNMTLTCASDIPAGTAKRMKMFLKSIDTPMKVIATDSDGNLVEDDGEPEEAGADAAATGAMQEQVQGAEAGDATQADPLVESWQKVEPAISALVARVIESGAAKAPAVQRAWQGALDAAEGGDTKQALAIAGKLKPILTEMIGSGQQVTQDGQGQGAQVSAAEVAKRLTAIKEEIGAVDGPMAEKLNAALAKVVAALKAGRLDVASAGADQLEAALARTRAAAPPPPPPPPPPPDPQMAKLVQLVQNFRSQAGLLEDKDAASAILGALAPAADHVKGGDKTALNALLTQVRALLDTAKQAQADAAKAADAIPDAPDGFVPASGPDYEAWITAFNRIEPDVNRALSQGLVEDVSILRRDWDELLGKAETGDHTGALSGLQSIRAMLDAGRAAGDTAHLADVPDEVRPFAISRIKWNDTRRTMMSEVARLEAMIEASLGGDEDLEMTDSLTSNLEDLDTRLSDALDDVVNAPAGKGRDTAKAAAQHILKQYQDALSKPFFQDVDNNSGFGSVAVASTARKALGEIARVLA
jgi:hypothetical protein